MLLYYNKKYTSFRFDASAHAICAELIQVQDGRERVVTYASYTLSPEQRRYCTTRRELLVIVRFTRQFRHYSRQVCKFNT
jgi:hypothetical protein